MILLQFRSPDPRYSVVIEDDGRVAYAYLLHDDEIVGDVWLYNHGPAPAEPEWRSPDAGVSPYQERLPQTGSRSCAREYERSRP